MCRDDDDALHDYDVPLLPALDSNAARDLCDRMILQTAHPIRGNREPSGLERLHQLRL